MLAWDVLGLSGQEPIVRNGLCSVVFILTGRHAGVLLVLRHGMDSIRLFLCPLLIAGHICSFLRAQHPVQEKAAELRI